MSINRPTPNIPEAGSPARDRRGFALLTIIILTLGMAALAASAVYLSGNAGLISTSQDREREFKYGAEAALAIGKSRLNTDPLVLPDTSYVTILAGQPVLGADGAPLPGVTVNLYTGPSGSTSGQFGRFASVVAEARDAQGARFVRRLELTQESFARYAYWSNRETNNGNTIYFANGDNLWGPVWSNDNISIASSGAWFHNEIGTAKTISGKSYGTFSRGYNENQPAIKLPSNTSLSKLSGYAASGNTNFATPNNAAAAGVLARVEFVAIDLGGPPDSTGVDEGFLKVYVANAGEDNWLRGDWTNNKATTNNCGAFYRTVPGQPKKFFPASVHSQPWFRALLQAGGMTAQQATDTSNASIGDIMAKSTARCYLGGDPHLVAIERNAQIGGDETTFTPGNGAKGRWLQWPGPVDPRVAARRADAQYLFPLYRGLNPGTKGVVAFNGTIGVSGVLRGRITIYSTANVIVLDDLRYATDPSTGKCADMLGIIAAQNITIADNSILGPELIQPTGPQLWKNFDDTKDVYVHGVMMAINTSFGAENYDQGPTNANGCEGNPSARGCLYLSGGLIQESRGPVGLTGGQGYVKRYAYDHCAVSNPPPYFPTTGRFIDNRYYEIDPVRFDVAKLFGAIQPGP
ncbi:MAG TPA: hypothetical protein VGN73_12635 [Gemmatimonadaceae bacterium]|jgi:hypothetical protein|nr:hypothetical protein [Gemmatimonadaceae bacterium]